MNAYQRGCKAGTALLAPSLNPFADGSKDEAEWDRGWREISGQRIAEADSERRRRAGVLAAESCTEIGT